MGLGKQERRGIVILVFVTLAITSLGFVMRYCDRPGDAASQVPVQTVIYRPAADDAAEGYGPRHNKKKRKKTHRKKSGGKRTKQSEVVKGSGSKAGASDGPRRDFLRDTIPVPRDYR